MWELIKAPRRLLGDSKLPFGFSQGLGDEAFQPFVASHSDDEFHTVLLAPRHQSVLKESGVAAQHTLHFRPALPDLLDDPLDLLPTSHRRPDIAGPQAGAQHVHPAEELERQIAVVSIVAVKNPVFPSPVKRHAGGFDVRNDPFGSH